MGETRFPPSAPSSCGGQRETDLALPPGEARLRARTGAFPTTTLVERPGLFGAAPHNLQAPRAAALEQLVGIDLVTPAEEMGLGLVLGRAIHRRRGSGSA